MSRFILFATAACAALPLTAHAQQSAPVTPQPSAPQPAPTPAPVPEQPDQPGAIWAPAAPGNFRPETGPTPRTIDTVVIHDIEGTALGAVSWFQNPKSRVSAHYVVDAVNGMVWQQVKERDTGYHAGNRDLNGRSIGIEHEGYAYRPGFYTTTLYEASAKLVRDITNRYQIPRDRTHIIGHFEVPNPSDPTKFGGGGGHTDPGPYWDWDYYMTLVRNDARLDTTPAAPAAPLHPGEKVEVSVGFTNTGDDPWPAQRKAVRDDALQSRGPVYLGTAAGTPSLLYGTGWVSPRVAAAPQQDGEVAPGAPARFTLTLNGPRYAVPGQTTVTETFRLTKVPPVPKLPVPFGPPVSVTVAVEPWEVVWDVAAAGFTASGWNAKEDKKSGKRLLWQKKPQAPAEWKGDLPLSGQWDVYARWEGGRGKASKAVYEVVTGAGTQRFLADQRRSEKGDGWFLLGRAALTDPKAVTVRLTAEDGGVVVADAIRLVGPFAPPTPTPAPAVLTPPAAASR